MSSARLPFKFGPYYLLKLLGEGGAGTVHLARPLDSSRGIPSPVVIKRLHGEFEQDEDFIKRFRHEALIAVSVDHPHIVKVFDAGSVGSNIYMAIEYVHGWRFAKMLDAFQKAGRLPPIGDMLRLLKNVLLGLHALHTAVEPTTKEPLGAIHRDISPQNLMVSEDGDIRLIDLGLGKSNVQDWKTQTGIVMGTLGYMAPEQVMGGRVDHRSDIYALAVVLWESLTLTPYVPRGDRVEMMRTMMSPKFRAPSKVREEVPESLDGVLKKALFPQVEGRWSSALAFHDALEEAVPNNNGDEQLFAIELGELLGTQLTEIKQEVQGLLEEDVSATPPAEEPTVVYAQRSGVVTFKDIAPTQSDIRFDDPTRLDDRDTKLERRRAPTVKATKPEIITAPLPMPEGVKPTSHRSATRERNNLPVRRGVPVSLVIVLIVVTAIVATLADRLFLREPTPPPMTNNPPEVSPEVVVTERNKPTAKARPNKTKAPSKTAEEKPEKKPRKVVERTERTEKPEPIEPPREEEPTAESLVDLFQQVVNKAKKKRKALPSAAKAVDEILVDASVWRANKDHDKAITELKKLEKKLDQLN